MGFLRTQFKGTFISIGNIDIGIYILILGIVL